VPGGYQGLSSFALQTRKANVAASLKEKIPPPGSAQVHFGVDGGLSREPNTATSNATVVRLVPGERNSFANRSLYHEVERQELVAVCHAPTGMTGHVGNNRARSL
jgi:hypothetical protein